MKNLNIIAAAVISVVLFATSAFAQDFQKGFEAYNAGDYATALQEWRPLAEQGDATAQYNLGQMYIDGQGVPQDYTEAVKLYRLAAEQGDADAQNNLGFMYGNGEGVLQDNVLAHMWYNLGAANGNELGAENRDKRAKKMTPQAIEQAQKMARECMSKDYKNCGY